MRYQLLREGESVCLSRATAPLGESLTLHLEGAGTEGTLLLGGRALYVHKGLCSVDASALAEGENRPVYTEEREGRVVRYPLEPLWRCGRSIGPRPMAVEQMLLTLCRGQARAEEKWEELAARVAKLESLCLPHDLF